MKRKTPNTSSYRWFGPTKKQYERGTKIEESDSDRSEWFNIGVIAAAILLSFAILHLRTYIVTTNHFTNEIVVHSVDGKKIPAGYCVTTQAVEYSVFDKISYLQGSCKNAGKEQVAAKWFLENGQFCVEDKADGRHIFFGDEAKDRKKSDFIDTVNSGVSGVMGLVEEESNISKSWQ